MKFLIVTLAPTLKEEGKFLSYAPYVYEMNLWSKYVDEVGILSPTKYERKLLLSEFSKDPKLFSIPNFSFTTILSFFKAIIIFPFLLYKLFTAMLWADHIHLRCPGNIALLGCLMQILFPNKPKTAKYAGNWDPKAEQPWSYKLQKRILSNTFLTKNMQVLVYGEWGNQTKNIKPFFTASYKEEDKKEILPRDFNSKIQFLFVGTLSEGKRPLLAIQIVEKLKKQEKDVHLSIYGEGILKESLENYIHSNNLGSFIILNGNRPKDEVKLALQKSHFLLLPSKSEGWPKVVAEAMFWGCLPIVTEISCVPYMLNGGRRGILISPNVSDALRSIIQFLDNEDKYKRACQEAMTWSRDYTLDKFESEIIKLLQK